MERRNQEAGQALILGVIALSVLLVGMAGLGIDMGYLRYQKRLMQSAADAAAIAGASNIPYSNGSGVKPGAQAAAVTNGFTDTSSNNVNTCTNDSPTTRPTKPPTVCVEIDWPPASPGPHQNDSAYVEARVSVIEPTFFMTLLGTYSEPVTARAVATDVSGANNSGGCLYTLAHSPDGISMSGGPQLTATSCGVNDNGDFSPSNATITAGTIGVAGTGSGSSKVTCSEAPTCPKTGVPAAADPLSYLTPPTVGTPTSFSCPGTGAVPGTYSGVTFTGNSNCNFNAGIYVLDGGGFTCHGTPTITGTGVMFYLTNGATWDCSGNDTLNLTAPSPTNCAACPPQYDGIVIYQDPNDTNDPDFGGNVGSTFGGAIYFPTADITFKGNPSGIAFGLVVAAGLVEKGSDTVILQGSSGLPTGVNLIKNAVLVE